ncbi:MAG: hypothetical protein EOO62_25475, partial [Hymenobacter sp.]
MARSPPGWQLGQLFAKTFNQGHRPFGLVQATVQKKSLNRAEVNFLFWISFVASVVMALLLSALSPLVAIFYEEPRVGPLIAAM